MRKSIAVFLKPVGSKIPDQVKDRWRKLWSTGFGSYIGRDDVIALVILSIGLVGFIPGPFPYFPGWTDLYFDLRSEMVGIGITVLIIANASEWVGRSTEKKRLILQMGSPSNAFALEAVRQLSNLDMLYNGSLRGFRLHGANLKDADLRGADLRGAKLIDADLEGAILEDADLRDVDFSGTGVNLIPPIPPEYHSPRMSGVNLNANFTGADLRGANLEGADLCRAILEDADLRGTNMRDARMRLERHKENSTMIETIGMTKVRNAKYDDETEWPFTMDYKKGTYSEGGIKLGGGAIKVEPPE